ncbi:putative acetyltransferase [Nakamurella sp. UYEF19]|uniref:GNAT family N-acetyltransferase n=1 Tax=Nakamurella sp. UYEF19 TaxID=1756392 RepID=UPI0033989F9C
MELRLLTDADADASTLMSHLAFGMPSGAPAAFAIGPDVRRWGIFDGNTLAAKANERTYDSMVGGRRVSTAGVAGVAVAPEYRGTGLARQVMTHLFGAARERGAVIVTLFRTAPALYRSLGFEQVAELVYGEFPTSALRGLRPRTTALRRATPADGRAIRAVYATIAATGSCLLTRDGPAFEISDERLVGSFDGVTLAIDEWGDVVGYLSWNRGSGYDESAALTVVDLLSTTGDGYAALLSAIGAFDAVTPTVRIRTSGQDPMHWVIPGAGWKVREVRPYMLRVIDFAGAVAARGWPPGLAGEVVLDVEDPLCPWNTGRHRLVLEYGTGRVDLAGTPGTSAPVTDAAEAEIAGQEGTAALQAAAPRITPGGLAVLFAGGVPVSTLRRGGLVTGSDRFDTLLDAAFAGPTPAVLDYF